MHIILILGTSGVYFNKDTNKDEYTNAEYYNNPNIDLPLLEGTFSNSSDVFMSTFPEANYTIISTDKALENQIKVFTKSNKTKHLDIINKNLNKINKLKTESEDIFNIVMDTIINSDDSEFVLDLTHGFRHQPLIASQAVHLGKIITNKTIKIILAKEIIEHKKYEYIDLDEFVDISDYAVYLTSFTQTLTIPDTTIKSELISKLKRFTEDLHTNSFYSLFNDTLPECIKSINEFKKDSIYTKFGPILEEVSEILKRFNQISEEKNSLRYFHLAKILLEKNFFLASLTYISEAIPLYIIEKLEDFGIEIKSKDNEKLDYYNKSLIIKQILNSNFDYYVFDDELCYYFIEYKEKLKELGDMTKEISEYRNNTVHINPDYNPSNLETNITKIYSRFEDLCIKNDFLKQINLPQLVDASKLGIFIQKIFSTKDTQFFEKFKSQLKFFKKYYSINYSPLNPNDKNLKKLEIVKNNETRKAKTVAKLLYEMPNSVLLPKNKYDKLYQALKYNSTMS